MLDHDHVVANLHFVLHGLPWAVFDRMTKRWPREIVYTKFGNALLLVVGTRQFVGGPM